MNLLPFPQLSEARDLSTWEVLCPSHKNTSPMLRNRCPVKRNTDQSKRCIELWIRGWQSEELKCAWVRGNHSDNSEHASQITDCGAHDWYEDTSTLLQIVSVFPPNCVLAALSCPWTVAGMHIGRPISGRYRVPLEWVWTWDSLIALQTSPQPGWQLREHPPRLLLHSESLYHVFWGPDFLGPTSFSFTDTSSNEILVCLILSWHVFLRGLGLTKHATRMSHFIFQQTVWTVMLTG